MKGMEPCQRRMVGSGLSFQKIHVIDILAAGFFNVPAGVETVHVRIDNDLEQLLRCRLIFPDPVLSLVQFRKIHALHTCTQKAHRIICRDHWFQIDWKLYLIIRSG